MHSYDNSGLNYNTAHLSRLCPPLVLVSCNLPPVPLPLPPPERLIEFERRRLSWMESTMRFSLFLVLLKELYTIGTELQLRGLIRYKTNNRDLTGHWQLGLGTLA